MSREPGRRRESVVRVKTPVSARDPGRDILATPSTPALGSPHFWVVQYSDRADPVGLRSTDTRVDSSIIIRLGRCAVACASGGAGTDDDGPWDGRSHGPRRTSFSRSAGQLAHGGKCFVQGNPVERLGDRWPVGEHDVCCRSIKRNYFARWHCLYEVALGGYLVRAQVKTASPALFVIAVWL